MDYVKLGRTGVEVSRICLGCMSYGMPERGSHPWTLDEESSRPFIKKALEAGINFFDTANVYSDGTSEEILGRALNDFAHRDEVVIATKLHGRMRPGPNGAGLSRRAILGEIDNSLRRLGTDHVDLYQIHRWDYHAPIEETLEALHDVVRAGKLYRRFFDVCMAVCKGARHCRTPRVDSFRQHAELLQPPLPRGGAGNATAVQGGRHWCDSLESARSGSSHPQLG
jgi:aryl-alcohol dehydrogenase-like predicted oxidoreductase